MFKKAILIIVALAALPAAALCANPPEAESLCEKNEIKQNDYKSCEIEGFAYRVNGKPVHPPGKLIKLYMGDRCKDAKPKGAWCDMPDPIDRYYLYTAEEKLIDLGEFKQKKPSSFSKECLRKTLGINGVSTDGRWHVRIGDGSTNSMATLSYKLEEGKIYTVYTGRDPFEGTVETLDGRNCTGGLKLQSEYIPWQEARDICREKFKKDTGTTPPNGEYGSILHVDEDELGRYYLCALPKYIDEEKGTKERWFYRLDMIKENKPTPIFLGKKLWK